MPISGLRKSCMSELAISPISESFSFRTTYGNLIDFNPGPIPKLVNLSEVFVHGGEASATLNLGVRWALKAYASDTVTEDEATGSGLRDVPRWLAGGSVLWRPIAAMDVELRLAHVDSYIDNAVPTGDVRLSGYQRCDVSVTDWFQSHANVYVGIENLFNRKYEEAVGFPAPGFFLRAGLQWKL